MYLCLVCRGTNYIFTEGLFLCLISDKFPPLFRAGGNTATVERILEFQEIDVNDRCSDGFSAIVYALKHRNPRAVNNEDNLGWTPLQLAVLEGDHIATQMLVRHAGIINHQSSNDDASLLFAVKKLNHQQSILIVDALLLHPELDVNVFESQGRTALWHAVNRGHHDLVKLLLSQRYLRLNDADRYGVTPLARAAEKHVFQILELLLKQPEILINPWTRQVMPLLWSACRAGNFHAVEALLRLRSIKINQQSPTGTTPLQVAVILNRPPVVSLLLRQGTMVDINAPGPQEWTAIFFAVSNGYFWLTKSLLKHPDININILNDRRRTLLWWAEHGGRSKVVYLLRRHGRLKRQKRFFAVRWV
ncbi:hypothetical protein N7520_009704 [Penicillium odoratum]|uniref:uncharacterized protein n=1 Tax=Penicillium odoratum TaxID=1167516 RepID=UPI002548BD1F|nr:uncharacterized protein N7520_009704 [Penicillium odoratum]KAJ5752787.1 hypothetical protein N7520_009704 [Penicillium odoratum]